MRQLFLMIEPNYFLSPLLHEHLLQWFYFTIVSDGTVIYSEVKAFLKKQENVITQYKSITTMNKTLTLSADHQVYVRKRLDDKFYPM